MFDTLCKNEFWQCVNGYNDYGLEMVSEEDLERYMWAAEHRAFPLQWKVLSGMRGIKEKHEKEKGRLG